MTRKQKEEVEKIRAGMLDRAQLSGWDKEEDHAAADALLCELLTVLKFEDVVENYQKIEKWYA